MIRTDPHSPGKIIPADYVAVLAYTVVSNEEFEFELGENAEKTANLGGYEDADRLLRTKPFWQHPKYGVYLLKCQVCGSTFSTGQIWLHKPTGEHVVFGVDCATKYDMQMDMSKIDLLRKRAAENRARTRKKILNEKARSKFLSESPGLAEALETDHNISRDLLRFFKSATYLTPGQVALAFKIAGQVKEEAAKPKEILADAPEGAVTIEGTVVSTKVVEGFRGSSVIKMTVKVITEAGIWLCWGTAPDAVLDGQGPLIGKKVRFTATLSRGDKSHFAFFKRPRKAQLVGVQS